MAKSSFINKIFNAGPLILLYYLCISEVDTNLEKIFEIFNCGYGKGYSVQQIVNIFKNQTFSHDSPTMESVPPAYYREFYYPLYLSVFYFFLDWKNYDYSICTVPNKTKIQNN